jgi:predicted transcriptional regulator
MPENPKQAEYYALLRENKNLLHTLETDWSLETHLEYVKNNDKLLDLAREICKR